MIPDFVARPNSDLWHLKPEVAEAGVVTRGLASWAIHAFGRHLIYPGSMALLKYMMRPNLNAARKLLVQNKVNDFKNKNNLSSIKNSDTGRIRTCVRLEPFEIKCLMP